MPDLKQSLGHRYLCETKFSRTSIREQERPRIGPAPAFKEYPGALYPIETYLAIEQVDGLGPGLFHFHVKDFALEQLGDQAIGKQVARAALDQRFVAEAAVIFLWSAIPRRNMAKYGHRGFRYICLDAGHICQNLLLAAAALGRKGCPVAALYDDELNGLLGLDGAEESVLYLTPVG